MVQCKNTSDCALFEYCDPTFHHCDKCKLLCARKTGTIGECQELCPRYLSRGILTAAAVTTEAAMTINIFHQDMNRKRISFQPETPLDTMFLVLALCIIILIILLFLLSFQVINRSMNVYVAARNNICATRGRGLSSSGNYPQREYRSKNQSMTTTTFIENDNTGQQSSFVKSKSKHTTAVSETEALALTQHTEGQHVAEVQETKQSEVSVLISPQQGADGMNDHFTEGDRISEHQLPEEIHTEIDTDLHESRKRDEGRPDGGGSNVHSSRHIVRDMPDEIILTPPGYASATSRTSIHRAQNDLNKESLLRRLPESSHSRRDGEASQGISQQGLNIPVMEAQQTADQTKKPSELEEESAETRRQRFKINKHIYETLRRLPYVDGYFSEGNVIDIFADLEVNTLSWVLRDLTKQTGQPADKFCVRHTTEQ